ncbi:hypothetical protein OEA41_003213 [Lepraria neglecta]|uniref:Uncharacterized protein n=1 Tax=Lepraria neglecta TaxID=209136 RepID=A0AAE0DIP3_9LECA|nr:hypothetical protein OEA41_003213 [Lepraria neglecta]
MQRVEKRLDDRADKLGRKEAFLGCPSLEFLDDLRFTFGEWLTEVEAEAKASEEDLAEFDAQWQKLHLAQSPLPLVGNKLVDDWNSSIRGLDRYLRSTKEHTSLGFASQCEHDPGSKTGGTTKRRDRRSAINQSLQSVRALATEYPDLVDPLLKAFESGCSIADACINIVAYFGRRGKVRRERHEQEVNIVTVEDVISVLPGHDFSITALYRVMETAALKNEHVTIVPPVLLNAWANDTENQHLIHDLRQYFQTGVVAGRTIYILPSRTQIAGNLAICSMTTTLCFTLLVGRREEELTDFENFLKRLFNIIFPRDFLWNRFYKLDPKWKKSRRVEDAGARLLEVFRATTGVRGVGEVLGYGKLVQENAIDYDGISLRLTSISHLKRSLGYRRNLEEDAKIDSPDAKSDYESNEDSEADPQSNSETEEDSENAGVEEFGKLESGDTCDFTDIWDKMKKIDMNDDQVVESLIGDAISEDERKRLEFTAEDKAEILAASEASPDRDDRDKSGKSNHS